MAYSQDQINAALQAELAARPGASYDAMVQQAANYGINPQEVAAAYNALYPQETINKALQAEVTARPGSSYDDLLKASYNYGVDPNEFNKAWANMGFTNAGVKDINKNGVINGSDVTAAQVQKALQDELAARPGSSYADLLKMANNVYGISNSTFNAGYDKYLQTAPVTKAPTTTGGTGTSAGATPTTISAGQVPGGSQVMGQLSAGTGWNGRQPVGASNGDLMGAGSGDYHSALIKSLRQNSMTPFSTNPGVLMAPNQGATSTNWTPTTSGSGGAFNPQVLNSRAASPQDVADWNAYSTYRTNALNAKTPILSMTEWLAGGKKDGTQKTETTPTTNPDRP